MITVGATAAVPSGAGDEGEGVRLVQRFAAAVAFLVQAALAALHHVNKVGQRLFLVHRDIPEVTTHRLQEEEEKEVKKKSHLHLHSSHLFYTVKSFLWC